MKPNVLLVEGAGGLGHALGKTLAPRFDCLQVATLDEAMGALARNRWAAVVAGYELADGGTGLEVLQVARTALPRAFRLLHTDIPSPGFHEDACRLGWPHFIFGAATPAPVGAIEHALAELLEPPSLEVPADLPGILTDAIVVRAPVSRAYVGALRAAAESRAPTYIHGEPGTGVTRAGLLLRQWRREWRARGAPGAVGGAEPVAIVRVPSLRERPQDLPLLAARILIEHRQNCGGVLRWLSPRAVDVLLDRDWFGNIVELGSVLANAIHRAGTRPVIEAEDLPQDSQPPLRPSQCAKDDGQRDCVLRQLRLARNVSQAAHLEGCSRANYIRLMRRLGIIRADVAVDAKLPDRARVSPD